MDSIQGLYAEEITGKIASYRLPVCLMKPLMVKRQKKKRGKVGRGVELLFGGRPAARSGCAGPELTMGCRDFFYSSDTFNTLKRITYSYLNLTTFVNIKYAGVLS